MSKKRVAIVYDWADTRYGGAEKVLLTLGEYYPEAELFTSFAEKCAAWTNSFPVVHTSFLQHFPRWLRRRKKLLAVLMPLAFESFDLTGFDLVISVSSFAAKGVLTKDHQRHVCYLLTPTRFLYSHTGDYITHTNPLIDTAYCYLRRWDQAAAHRPDTMIAISRQVSDRAAQYYDRVPDDIIYPTILYPMTKKNKILPKKTGKSDRFFLCVGRLTPYKKISLVAQICGEHGWPLVILGTGPESEPIHETIRAHGWSHITMIADADVATVNLYYARALALVAPGLEDFGINLLEANRAGTLVVTHPDSGGRELLDANMARDLDPRHLSESLIQTLSELYEQPRFSVPRQNQDRITFIKQWKQKVGTP